MSTAAAISPVVSSVATTKAVQDWTLEDFMSESSRIPASQREYVTLITNCTLWAVNRAIVNQDGSHLNRVRDLISPKFQPAWQSWLFFFGPFSIKAGKETVTVDGLTVERKGRIRFDTKRAVELAATLTLAKDAEKLAFDPTTQKPNNPGILVRLSDMVLGSLRSIAFDAWERKNNGGTGKAPMTQEAFAEKVSRLMEKANKEGLNTSAYSKDTRHSAAYHLNALANMDEHDLTAEELGKVRIVKGEQLSFHDILQLVKSCTKENITPIEEALYEQLLLSAAKNGYEL